MLVPLQSQPIKTGEPLAQPRDPGGLLQPNVEQAGRVVSVRQDPSTPTLFRIQVDIGNSRIEVMTNKPLMEGVSILVTRGRDGELQLRLPTPIAAPPTAPASATTQPAQAARPGSFIALIAPQSREAAAQLTLQTTNLGIIEPKLAQGASSNTANIPGSTTAQTGSNTNALQSTGSPTQPLQTSTGSNPSTPTNAAQQAIATNPSTLQPTGLTTQGAERPSVQPTGTASLTNSPAAQSSASPLAGATALSSAAAPVNTSTQAPGPTASGPIANTNLGQPAIPARPAATAASTTQPNNTAGSASKSTPAAAAVPQSVAVSQTSISGTQPVTSAQTPISQGTAQPSQTNTPPANPVAMASESRSSQLMNRTVQSLQPNTIQIPLDLVRVNINGQSIELLTPRPVLAGQQVELIRLNENQVELRIRPNTASQSLPAEVIEEMQQLMRNTLPTQAPLADSLNQLRALATGKPQDAVGQLVRSLMGLFSMQPKGTNESQSQQVKQLINQSGLFTEANLVKKSFNRGQGVEDLRTRLGRLNRLSQDLPTAAREQLQQLLQRAEARATNQQFQSIQQWREQPDGSAERYYRVDIPVLTQQGFENVELRLKEHRPPEQETERTIEWTLNLHFDFEQLGPVDARLHLHNEWVVSARFWAERRDTTEYIRDRLKNLDGRLSAEGFEVESLNVQRGKVPAEDLPPLYKNLVDLHT